jgi:tetratricopeptide (TPR) repeat protein
MSLVHILRMAAVSPLLTVALVGLLDPRHSPAQDELSAEEARQQQAVERFISVLEARPRFGVALDRVYGHFVERGQIEQFTRSYRDRTAANAEDGIAWMVLGMLEFQRGRDAEAVAALTQAEKHLPEEPLASFYLGQAYVLVGRPDDAAAAFERAISRNPQRTDLLQIYQALGRVHQRAHHNAQALAVWDRLEQEFPDDLRVQEEIARTLAEEGQHESALTRYEQLVKRTDDSYQQVQFALRAAELKLKLGRSREATTDMEALLVDLKPDSWLYQDVRQRIEDVYLRTDDYAGLSAYYEEWLENNPDDVDAMTRLGEALASQGRTPEAREWYGRAIERAPSEIGLRLAFIEQLVAERDFAEAVVQFEELDKHDPGNPDHIAEWGRLILEDKAIPAAERAAQASAVWKKLLDGHPDDPVIITQVADLHRHAELNDQAIDLYRRAVELAPNDPQYREYLGEFYHRLKRPDDAKATWAAIISGNNRTTRNLVRLAEVYAGFGYMPEALATMREACALDPEFSDRLRFAEMLLEEAQLDEALEQIDAAAPMAETPDERQLVLNERIRCYQASGELPQQIAALRDELDAALDADSERWQQLALYYEADRNMEQATAAVRTALELDPDSIPALTTAARIYESSGQLGDAAATNERLTDLDRRFRTEYLTEIARLRMRLGQADDAIQAANDLLAAAPGNPEHYQFYADLCFQLGRTEEGLEALRRSAAVNPADETALLALAGALGDQFRTDEAIELYWRAFERSPDLEGQISVVVRLTDLYLRTNHFDRLVSRLESMARELDNQRDITICLANAYSSAGDLGTARITLESLVGDDSRDVQLLTQLVRLAELEEDFEGAVRYQRRVNELAPSAEGTVKLANLLMQTGEIDEAEAAWTRIVEESAEAHRVYQAIDRLMTNGKFETVVAMSSRLLQDDPQDWEALTRCAIAQWRLDDHEAAVVRCRELLAAAWEDDELSAEAKDQLQQRQSSGSMSATTGWDQYPEVLMRTQASYEVRQALGLSNDMYYYGYSSGMQSWAPRTFGQARIAALFMLLYHLNEQKTATETIAAYRAAGTAEEASQRELWDWYYVLTTCQALGIAVSDNPEAAANLPQDNFNVLRRLSDGLDPGGCLLYLSGLSSRPQQSMVAHSVPGGTVVETTEAPKAEPLSAEELEHALQCFQIVRAQASTWKNYSVVYIVQPLLNELKLAGRQEQADALYEDLVASAATEMDLMAVMGLAVERGELDRVLEIAGRIEQRRAAARTSVTASYYTGNDVLDSLTQLAVRRFGTGQDSEVLRIFDAAMAILRTRFDNLTPSQRQKNSSWNQGPVQIPIYFQQTTETPQGQQTYLNSNYVQLDYPFPNAYFDYPGISLLRNFYENYNREDTLAEFVRHIEDRTNAAEGPQAAFGRLALCYIYWWHDLKEDSADELEAVVNAVPDDLSLRLQLASMQQQQGDAKAALATLDAVEPLNQNQLQQREMLALQLAVTTGNPDRARQAGERLFGLRLTTEIELQLADFMHQAGLHDLAESLLERARRSAGNRASSLLSLLQHYQTQGDTETAVEIAFQILRRSGSSSSMNPSADDSARQTAIQVLSQSGQLETLIERARQQLERSPNSLALHQTLADYYSASGDTEKHVEMMRKIAALRPNDAALQYQIAQQLASTSNYKDACDFYLAALRAQPSLLSNDYYTIQSAFEQAQRNDDFIAFLKEVDLTKLGQSYYVTNLIQNLLQNEATRQQALDLFQRMWDAFPAERPNMLSNIYQDDIWQLPVMYQYVHDAVIPADAAAMSNPWAGLQDYNILSRLVTTARSQNKLDPLYEEVLAKTNEIPNWHAGQAVLAVIEAQRGNFDASAARLTGLMDSQKQAINLYTRYYVALQLKEYEPLAPTLVRWYEEGMHEYQQDNWGWGGGPKTELAELYVKVGRKHDARTALLEVWTQADFSRYYGYGNAGYAAYARLANAVDVGQRLTTAGFPVDALRIYGEASMNPTEFQQARQYGGDYYMQQFEQGRTAAAAAINADTLTEALALWLTTSTPRAPDSDAAETQQPGAAEPTTDENPIEQKQPAIDLLLTVQSQSLRDSRVTSLFEPALDAIAGNEEALARVTDQLDAVRRENAADFSVDVVSALLAFSDTDSPERWPSAIQQLIDRMNAAPLEELPGGERPGSAQRAAAKEQLALWIVAREALRHPETRDAGLQLADRALAAARLQSEDTWALAMLREQGETSLQTGDRSTAEGRFLEMLDIILPQPDESPAEETPDGEDRLRRRPTQAVQLPGF